MQVVKTDNTVFFDVDDTLVMWDIPEDREHEVIVFESFSYPTRLLPHLKHIELMKQFKARGHLVVVWSQGGYEWAEAVVNRLDIAKYVDIVMSKPKWIVDDLPASAWTSRSYLDLNGKRLTSAFVPGHEEKK